MNTPFLSVIIPIYKVEDYLERCVKSVLNQDFKDIEVILVDDGSPDRCPQICDEFAKTDERIKVLHKPNGGLSSARNAGIEIAAGEYLAFLDSDDQWNSNKLSAIAKRLVEVKPTMLTFASMSLYEDGSLQKRQDQDFFSEEFRTLDSRDYYKILIGTGNLHESACTKMIRKDFLVTNELYFKKGILCEDTEWMFRVLRLVSNISISSVPLFICTENRPGSISNTASTRSVRDMLSIIESCIESNTKIPTYTNRHLELAHCAYLWSICMGVYKGIPKEDKTLLKKRLKGVVKHLNLNSHPKSKKVAYVYKFLGFNVTVSLLGLYLKLLRCNMVNKKEEVHE